jgi:hypothetical protein
MLANYLAAHVMRIGIVSAFHDFFEFLYAEWTKRVESLGG